MVIHDRWMLREPLVIWRSEIRCITPVERLAWWQYSAFASAPGKDLGASGPLLHHGGRPNCRIEFDAPRSFREAIRMPPSKTPVQPVSRGTVADALQLLLVDAETSMRHLDDWMAVAQSSRSPDRSVDSGLSGCLSGCLADLALWGGGLVGFALFCLGLAVGAPT
jgi:hypothetical protein